MPVLLSVLWNLRKKEAGILTVDCNPFESVDFCFVVRAGHFDIILGETVHPFFPGIR